MTYKQCLKPWAVARQLPTHKWVIIGRYRSRNDADGHLQLLLYSSPEYEIYSCVCSLRSQLLILIPPTPLKKGG
jgi:hypothetical protein